MKTRLAVLSLAILGCVASVSAMDRWTALSMIESGNDDAAVGQRGEISRFQIRPQLWLGGDPRDAQTALIAAQKIMAARVLDFQRTHFRSPTDFEFYVLWNAPAVVNHPPAVVAERARRFSNLVQRTFPLRADS